LHLSTEANNIYDLFLRYKFQPEIINHYTIEVKPHWWQSKTFYIILAVLIILLAILSIIFFLKRREKIKLIEQNKKQREIQLQLKSIRSQLNPHFIFNSLNSIQGLINKNDVNGANEYLTDFAGLMRETLTGNNKEMNSISQEINILHNYLRLEQLRFKFQYEIHVDENVQPDSIEIPSLLLQPLVENAVKHGIAVLQEKGEIKISFQQSTNNLLINIFDNGKGFDANAITNGMGLRLTNDRIELLNQSLKNQSIKLSFNSISNGTVVNLIFENWI
jgi:two-component system, LytTR family, sensor kinase